MYKRQRLPGPPATVRSVGTGQAGEVELRRQTPRDSAVLTGYLFRQGPACVRVLCGEINGPACVRVLCG